MVTESIRSRVRSYPLAALDKEKRELALEYAMDIRKFEIELYWTRSSYFWAFIGAAIAGYGAVQSLGDADIRNSLSQIVCSLGLVFSFSWYFANRGSKQWHENWENHVELLEDDLVGPLHKTTVFNAREGSMQWLTGSGPYSVSKINQIVSIFTIVLWAILYKQHLYIDVAAKLDGQACLIAIASIGFIILMWRFGRTDLRKREFTIECALTTDK